MKSSDPIKPQDVGQWFPPEIQKTYVEHIVSQSGLNITPLQAHYFVKLWGYAYVKQYGPDSVPISTLTRQVSSFYCSHSDAASLFYGEEPLGSPRSAGHMLDKLASKSLLRRGNIDGFTTRLSLNIPRSFELPSEDYSETFYTDTFDPRNDAPLVASFLENLYIYDPERPESIQHNLKKGLRQWARQYPDGLRVLRRTSTREPVGFTAFFPIHPVSERIFDMDPKMSVYLSRMDALQEDPVKMAEKGDPDCYVAYMRIWQIMPVIWSYDAACLMVKDSQETLREMLECFPNLSDIYTMAIHPLLEEFALTLGFQSMLSSSDSSLRWLYMSLDRLLDVDYEDVLLNFDYTRNYG